MTNASTEAAANPAACPTTTDLESQVAASEHTSIGAASGDDVRVAERHGIWTVTAAGTFLGDYLDQGAALAAAAQARPGEHDGGEADPWQRLQLKLRP